MVDDSKNVKITTEMIKKHLPPEIIVNKKSQQVNCDADVFMCYFPDIYEINGEQKRTAFAVVISNLEKMSSTFDELSQLIEVRCKVAYEQAFKHHENTLASYKKQV